MLTQKLTSKINKLSTGVLSKIISTFVQCLQNLTGNIIGLGSHDGRVKQAKERDWSMPRRCYSETNTLSV